MGRYIDAEWLKQNFNTVFWPQITKTIDSAPSIEIIRCGECKWFNEKYGSCHAYHWDLNQGLEYAEVDADDFCSYGEREGE